MLLVLREFFNKKSVPIKIYSNRNLQSNQINCNQSNFITLEMIQSTIHAGIILPPFFGINWFLCILSLEEVLSSNVYFKYTFMACNTIFSYLVFFFLDSSSESIVSSFPKCPILKCSILKCSILKCSILKYRRIEFPLKNGTRSEKDKEERRRKEKRAKWKSVH